MKPLPVLVTGVGGGGYGAQILKALRLASTPYVIVGSDITPYSTGLTAVDHPYILPPASHPDYIHALLTLCLRHHIVALFPGSEPELKVISARRRELQQRDIFVPLNPEAVLALCLDKVRTSAVLQTQGFRVPVYQQISSLEQLETWSILPAVLKPATGSGGSANAFLAQTPADLHSFGRYLLSLYSNFIVQEYIGTPESEFTVGVLIDMQGELINSIAVKRNILTGLSNRCKVPNRTDRLDLGPILALSNGISQGTIGPFPEVTETCERLALALGCRGASNIQCRLVADQVYVFEINPRFSGTTSLRAMVGFNEPDVLVRKHVLGESIASHFSYRSGVIMRELAETFIDHQAPDVPGV